MRNIKSLIISIVLRISGSFFKYIKYTTNKDFKKINIGCGLHCLPGWINIDGSLTALLATKRICFLNKILYKLSGASNHYSFSDYNNIIKNNNLKFYNFQKGFPISGNYADVIYSSHFLEHLNKKDGKILLENCFRSLKKGGLMRIIVPDLDSAIKMYQDGEVEKMLDSFFYNSERWDFSAHKYHYNFNYLKSILLRIGFVNINKLDYKIGNCPDISYLDNYPNSLFIECSK